MQLPGRSAVGTQAAATTHADSVASTNRSAEASLLQRLQTEAALRKVDTANTAAAKAASAQEGLTRESNRISSDALTSVQRAFIVVNEMSQTPSPSDPTGDSFLVGPIIENGGNTPAFIKAYAAASPGAEASRDWGGNGRHREWQIGAPSDPADLLSMERTEIGIGIERNITLGPKARIIPPQMGGSESISGNQAFNGASTGANGRFFYGAVIYSDAFGGSHITKYCFRIDRAVVSAAHSRLLDTARCSHWNCTDEQCSADKRSYLTDLAKVQADPRGMALH